MKCLPFLSMMLVLCLSARAQIQIEKSPLVIRLDKNIIPCCGSPDCRDSICYSLPIKRKDKNQTVILLISQCCTYSYISLYIAVDYYKFENKPEELDWKCKKHDEKKLLDGQPLNLNLTGLEDGIYIAEYSGDLGGLLKIILSTE